MFVNYEEYINSQAWRDKRQKYFESKLPQRCWACNKRKAAGFHIHHRTYKRLGNEYLRDLVLLCPGCHTGVHKLQKTSGMRLWGSTNHYIRAKRKELNLPPNAVSQNQPRTIKA